MNNKKIVVIRDWLELQLVWDIQVFLRIANFYRQFIQGSSLIAALLTSMLHTAIGPQVNKSIYADNINEVDSARMILKLTIKALEQNFLSSKLS